MNLRTLKLESEITAAIKTFLDFGDTYKEIELIKQILKIINSEPATVECEECKGKGYKKSHLVKTEIGNFFLYTCPSCTDGQRPLMKVRRCPKWKIEQIHHPSWCSICDGIGKITELLTLADIDWGKSELKLKRGCEVK